ncbi:TetR/AcrR family transcriptional regulator [Blastococcus sp. SYSU D00820]
MPKVVDRESRRAEIVTAYLRIVAREGIEQASSRALAAELGVASGALWHYFADFDEVLSAAFRRIFADTNRRIAAAVAAHRGLAAVAGMLGEILPLSPVTHDEALVVVSFWGRVPSRPELAAFQSEAEAVWRADLLAHLADAHGDGHLDPDAPLELLADTFLVLCIGQQIEHVLRTEVAHPARQWELVSGCLSPWLSAAGRAAGGLPVPR